jgi:hypothetical protein
MSDNENVEIKLKRRETGPRLCDPDHCDKLAVIAKLEKDLLFAHDENTILWEAFTQIERIIRHNEILGITEKARAELRKLF